MTKKSYPQVAEYATQKESEWGTSEAAAKELRGVLFSAPEGPPPGSSVLNLYYHYPTPYTCSLVTALG